MIELQIISETFNSFGDKIYQISVKPSDMIVFGYIIESLEGWAFHTLINKEKSIMHVEVMKDYIYDFMFFLDLLKTHWDEI